MICSRRGALWKYANLIWSEVKKTTANWMPNGLIPKTVVWIGAEAVGAIGAEALVPVALFEADKVLDGCITFYRQIPLCATSALLIYTAIKTSKKALAIVAIGIPVAIYAYSLKDLEDKTCEIAGFFILQISQIFGAIGGGFFGLSITDSPEVFSTYRENMIVHALTGRGFEALVKQPNALFFIPRLLTKITLQTVAYNRKIFWSSFKLSIRNKQKKLGFIAPTLTKVLIQRFDAINTKTLALDVCNSILPFFLAKKTPFFSAGIQGLISREIARLQSNSETLIFILTRSLIEYKNLISTPKISSLIGTISYLTKEAISPEIIETAIQTLSQELKTVVMENTPSSRIPVQQVGDSLIWNEQNLDALTETISKELKKIGIYLFGKAVYPDYHIHFLEIILKVHAKPFVYFTILRGLGMDISGDPLEDFEDINLSETLYQILFFSLAEPLLPDALRTPIKKTSTAALLIASKTVQSLQGRPKQAEFKAPFTIVENYVSKGDKEPVERLSDSDYDLVTE